MNSIRSRSKSEVGRGRRRPAVHGSRRLLLEGLEERILLATPLRLGTLAFEGNFIRTSPTVYTLSGGDALLGYDPATTGGAFQGLLDIKLGDTGQLDVDTSGTTFSFTNAEVALVVQDQQGAGTPIYKTAGTAATTWDARAIDSSSGQGVENATPFVAKGLTFTLTSVSFADSGPGQGPTNAAVQMQGKAGFVPVSNFNLSVLSARIDGDNYLVATSSGLTLTGLTLDARAPFTEDFAGLTTSLSGLSVTYNDDAGKDKYTFSGIASITSKSQDGSGGTAFRGVQAGIGLSIEGGSIQSTRLSVGGSFRVFGLQVASNVDNPLTFSYDTTTRQFEGQGEIVATIPAKAGSTQAPTTVDLLLGYANSAGTPGIIVDDGVLTQFNATVKADFSLYGIAVSTAKDGLTFAYDRADEDFELYGNLDVSFNAGGSPQRVTANLGTQAAPGFEVKDGRLDQLNLALSGQLNLFGLVVTVDEAGVSYSRDRDEIGLFGSIQFQKLFDVRTSLGTAAQPGIVIRDGRFELDDVELDLDNVNFGAFNLKQFVISYRAGAGADAGDFTFTVQALVVFPAGWAVGGTFSFLDGVPNEIDLNYSVTSGVGIEIADTGLALTYIDASVDNLADPSNIVVHGAANFTYGTSTSLLGYNNVSPFVIGGTFTVDRDHLYIAGGFYLGAYSKGTGPDNAPIYQALLSQGTGSVNLDWGSKVYTAQASLSLYNNTIAFAAGFAFNSSGDFVLGGKASLNVPSSIPFIGGDNIASADFLLEYHKDDPSSGFVAAWVTVDVDLLVYSYTVEVGIQYNFDGGSFRKIGGDSIDSYANCLTDPSKCLSGNATYTYYSAYNININGASGATAANLSVNWPTGGGTQSVEVTRPDGTVIKQADFGSSNGISLVPQLSDATKTTVHLVGSASDPNVPLAPGSYTLTLVSNQKFDEMAVTFGSAVSYPVPTVGRVTAGAGTAGANPAAASARVPVALSGTVDEAFKGSTRVTLYVDDIGDADGSRATPVAGAVNMPIATDGRGNWTLNPTWDTSNLTPVTQYYVYAVIHDGTNAPVNSRATARSAAVTPIEGIYGTVANTAPGPNNGQPIAGVIVYLDLNRNGRYDGPTYNGDGTVAVAGEPEVSTNSAGFYNFGPGSQFGSFTFQANTPYDVGVVVPAGFLLDATDPENSNPRRGVVFNGTPNDQNFGLYQPASISGTVFEDLNSDGKQEANEPGLADRAVTLIDTADPAAAPIQAYTNGSGFYRFLIAQAGTYVVAPAASTTLYNTSPARLTSTIQGTPANPYPQFTGQNFGLLAYSSVSGTVAGYAQQGGSTSTVPTPLAGWTVTARRVVAIDAGSPNRSGNYGPDADFTGGTAIAQSTYAIINTDALGPDGPNASIMGSYRFGKDFTYRVPGFAPGSNQIVRLDFAELFWTSRGQRVFDVLINGQAVLTNFDVLASGGLSNQNETTNAITRSFTATADAAGTIAIRFVAVVDHAEINAITITSPDVATTTTDTSGAYQFDRLLAGPYVVSQVVQPGWRAVSPAVVTPSVQQPAVAIGVPNEAPGRGNSSPTAAVAGNFLNDGGDLAVLDSVNNRVWIYPTSDPGNSRLISVLPGANAIVSGDFLGTGRQDLAVISNNGTMQLLINDGPGSANLRPGPIVRAFPQSGYFTSNQVLAAVSGRFTADGVADQVAILYGDFEFGNDTSFFGNVYVGLGYFRADGSLAWKGNIYSPARYPNGAFDIDNLNPAGSLSAARAANGFDDILVCFDASAIPYGGGPPTVLLSPSRGTTQVVSTRPTIAGALGDINGDGRLDAVIIEVNDRPPTADDYTVDSSYLIQDAAGNFIPQSIAQIVTPHFYSVPQLALGDIDGDGRLDVVYTVPYQDSGAGFPPIGFSGFYTVRNTGVAGRYFDGADQQAWATPVLANGGSFLTLDDVNGDGKLDFVVGDTVDGQFAIATNTTTVDVRSIMLTLAGTNATNQDFVNIQAGALSGRVFTDAAGDGLASLAKPGVAGATVFLDLNGNGVLDPGEPTAVTGPTGLFSFADVAPGTYAVALAPTAGRRPTSAASMTRTVVAGASAPDADFGSAVGVDAVVVVPAGARGNLTVVRVGDRLEVIDGELGVLGSYALAGLDSLTIDDAAGRARSVAISLVGGGFFAPPGGIAFRGAGTAAVAVLLGPGADAVTVGAGRATIDSSLVVTWAGAASAVLDAGAGDDRVVVNAPTPAAPLLVEGGAGDDIVRVDAIASSLRVDGGDGNDTIAVSPDPAAILVPLGLAGGNGDDTIQAGPRGDILSGGPGNNRLLGGAGDDVFLWVDGDGNDSVDGGDGYNVVRMETSTTLGDAVVVAPNGDRALVMMTNVYSAALDLGEIQLLDLATGGGADLVSVTPLGGTAVHVDAGGTGPDSGDRVIVQAGSSPGAAFSLLGPTAGAWTFLAARPVAFENAASFNMPATATYVAGLYRTVLRREATAAEVNAWAGSLMAGATPALVARLIWESPEHRGLQVDDYYARYLHRAADPAGRASWVAALLGGASENAVQGRIFASPEYQARNPGPARYLAGVYRDLLGRNPTQGEAAASVAALRRGASRSGVVDQILASDEFANQLVARDYGAILGRPGSKPEVRAWARQLTARRLTPAQVAERFLASDEFRGRVQG